MHVIKNIPVNKIFLYLENFRHKPLESESEVMSHLCKDEMVINLARDIASIGLSPADNFLLIEQNTSDPNDVTYVPAEGNRRLCALKLLRDPELAPASCRSLFKELSANWNKIDNVYAALFENFEDAKPWVERLHAGQRDGTGRKDWDTEQKARAGLDSRNLMAMALLDYAQGKGMITETNRRKKLTTVQSFIGSKV